MSVTIGRLRLRVPGADAEAGARLAQLVAERLAPPLTLAPGEGALEKLEVELAAVSGESPESLAGRIAAQVARRIVEDPLEPSR